MRRSDLHSLDDLRAFEATARLGSVRAAADELSLTHAAISRRNTRLAELIGAPLFKRSGRGLEITPAGALLSEACSRSFADLSRAISLIRELSAAASGPILLSCERSVAMRWLIPRLSQFQDANPDLAVHLSVGGGPVEGQPGRDTLALRRLDFQVPEGWQVEPLWAERVGPVMAPGLLDTFRTGDYIALGTRTRPSAWSDWLAAYPEMPRPRETRMLDHHFLMIEAACGGLGVALAPRVVAVDDLNRGRLVAPHGFAPDGTEYGLLHGAYSGLSEGAQRLQNWIRTTSINL
ncbi:MAG: LysR family transcriptional regulator [Pseudomonadota bacterium]